MLLFPGQILKNSLRQKTRSSVCIKTHGRVFQLLVSWFFEALRKNQKLDGEFEKFSWVLSKKVVRVIKGLATCLRYNTTHDVAISHGKEG